MMTWNLKKNITTLELVQIRATKRAPEIKHKTYEERMKKLDLTTLEERRVREDLIEQFKIINGYDTVNWYKNQ